MTTTLGALLLASLRAGSRWPAPLTAGGYAATAVAAVMAVPDAGQVGAVLFLAAVQSTALGLARNRAGVLATAPPLAAAGWGLLALDAVGGGALWYTVPVGAALLAEAEIGRWAVRQAGQPPATSGTLPLEWLGFVVLGAPLLVRTAADPPAALLATLVGAALVWWGAATRVRRRLWAGGAIGGAAPTLLLVVPLVRVLPAVRGPGLWLGLALVGVLLVGAAAALEPLRAVAAGTRERVSGRFEGWE